MSKLGPPDYPEATKVAQALVKAAPERLVWGSDWPHPSEQNRVLPDDAPLFDLLAVWAPDDSTRKRILVDYPENLYGFAKSARLCFALLSAPRGRATPHRPVTNVDGRKPGA